MLKEQNLVKFYFAKQLINAIKTFYLGKLVHFDIKPPNILLFKNFGLKLIDFSFVKKLDKKDKKEKKDKEDKKGHLTKVKQKRIFQEPFVEKFGDNLTRYFAKQLINAIKTFYLGKLVHFDIKPPNILLFKNFELKLIDFSFVKKLDKKDKKERIPGGTNGYLTPEYYNQSEELMDFERLQTQDFFAIGATIFYLKYGIGMLDYFPFTKRIEKREEIKFYQILFL